MADDEDILENEEEEALSSEEEATEDIEEPEPEPEPEMESEEPPKAGGAKSPLPMIVIGIVVGLIIGLVVGMLMGGGDLQSDVDDLEAQVDQLESDLASKDTEISDLQANITDNQAQISQLQAAISENQSKLSDNITRLGYANENITALQGNITTLNANIDTLNENITALQNENEVLIMEADMREPHIVHLQSPFLDIDCADCHNVDSQGTVIIREDYFYDESDLSVWTFRRDVNAEDCTRCHGEFPTEGTAMTEDYMNVTWLEENGQSCISAASCHSDWKTDMAGNADADVVDLDYVEEQVTGADTETIAETCLTCHGDHAWYEGHP